MKYIKYFMMALFVSIFTIACNDDEGLGTDEIKDVTIENGTLKFKDQATFDSYVESGKCVENFYSMYDNFTEAMDKAESYYDRDGGYEEFKAKYSNLYFPEYEDDYSAYLPVSDKNVAKLLDSNGNVIIGDETKKLTDIKTYSQLKSLGMTMPEKNVVSLRATTGTNEIDEEKNSDRNRKIWVKSYIRFEKVLYFTNHPVLWIEVCFRKKGFLGRWYNYSSSSVISSSNVNGLIAPTFAVTSEKIGQSYSSHDYQLPIKSYVSNKQTYYCGVSGDIQIDQRGMDKTLTLTVSYDGGVWSPRYEYPFTPPF